MKITIQKILAPVAICAGVSSGCATSYSPREPGRISFVMEAGHEVLEKDGKKYNVGGFSGDLIQAVSGNPAAEEHARTYVRRQRSAAGLTIGFIGGLLVGDVLVALAMADPAPGVEKDRRPLGYTGLSLLAGGVACLIGALILGPPEGHLYDAINIYNDGVAQRRMQPGGSE